MSSPEEQVASLLVALHTGGEVTQSQIREMGRIAKDVRIERTAEENYVEFLGRILIALTQENS